MLLTPSVSSDAPSCLPAPSALGSVWQLGPGPLGLPGAERLPSQRKALGPSPESHMWAACISQGLVRATDSHDDLESLSTGQAATGLRTGM
jgi:hypothetical protein